ncbi:dihydroorotate dehydrogenase [Shimia sp. FJ5]|uniref:dihydroorotate dehydrogenase n=1 Tax=Shimia sp. FJ5 TaxID=3079054 RepID=UPI00262A5BBD|nr:dihydroorotate dehydrogenase [Shimia sp. FJ5]MDV4145377.1 dihydroorotate dehydrogenase [Shimia sp. FJ5]
MNRLETHIGDITLKNPIIAAPAEHMIADGGLRAAIDAGAGAVVVKSTNESQAAKAQLRAAEYVALDTQWQPVTWGANADPSTMILSRSGLHPLGFEDWLAQCVSHDRIARDNDCLLVPSLILADLDRAIDMALAVQSAGLRVLEFNIGTPYGREAAKGAVSTETAADRVGALTRAMTEKLDIPVWVKLTGQSSDVPDLAASAADAGAQASIVAGRLLGMLPDLETMQPMLGTSGGFGGFWNLPLTCHWLALCRAALGPNDALIGINGITGGHDVARALLSGASAAGLASAVMLRGFDVISDSISELDAYCHAKGVTVVDLIGRAADARKAFADMPELDNHWQSFVPPQSK